MEQIMVVLKLASWVPVTQVASLIEDEWLVTLVLSLQSSVLLRLFTALLRPCVYHSLPCGTPPAWGASNLLTTGNVLTVRLIFLSRTSSRSMTSLHCDEQNKPIETLLFVQYVKCLFRTLSIDWIYWSEIWAQVSLIFLESLISKKQLKRQLDHRRTIWAHCFDHCLIWEVVFVSWNIHCGGIVQTDLIWGCPIWGSFRDDFLSRKDDQSLSMEFLSFRVGFTVNKTKQI